MKKTATKKTKKAAKATAATIRQVESKTPAKKTGMGVAIAALLVNVLIWPGLGTIIG